MEISYFENIYSGGVKITLPEVLEAIKNGKYEEPITELRNSKGDDNVYGELKKKLPSFTASGLFDGKRKKENLKDYNPVIILDIDKVGEDKAIDLRNKSAKIPLTYSSFISPGGKGVKILVKADSTSEIHEDAFEQVKTFYENKLGVTIDLGKDIPRLCFVSNDPDLYLNEESEIFLVQTITKPPTFSEPTVTSNNELFNYVVSFTEKIDTYFPGNRNNFIYRVANNLNRVGVDKFTAESELNSAYPDMSKEIPAAVKSAFKNEREHGIFPSDYVRSVSSVRTVTSVNLKMGSGTPFIPKEVYDNLPDLLKKGVTAFEVQREKDIFLTGALTVLSGCFPTLKGIYDGREFYPNLNCFVIAPPSGGKGVLIYARILAEKIHNVIKAEYKAGIQDNENQLRTLFIPADSSSAAVKTNLKLNNGIGIICETEADTLSATFMQDWGSYSDLIRKAFQHEPITYSRQGEDNDIILREIPCPKLSLCISGTPSQVTGLLKSTEDGLFSRIIFYNFRYTEKPEFKNVFRKHGVVNLTEYFQVLSNDVYQKYKLIKSIGKIIFIFSYKQQKKFNGHFNKMLDKIFSLYGEESVSVVFRLGLITFRIAMLLTLLRKINEDKLSETIVCDDVDFDSSLLLSEVYLEHALSVFQSLPGTIKINPNAKVLFEFLPNEFSYTEALNIGKVILGVSDKTVSNYLNELKEVGWIKQPKKNGMYYKSNLQ